MNLSIKPFFLLLIVLLFNSDDAIGIERPSFDNHPRLLLTELEKAKVDTLISRNQSIQKLHNYIINASEELLLKPNLKRILTGKRLLSVSREAIKRIFYLSYAYRFSNNEAYAQRAIEEIISICQFQDWNPSHFLDVAEMTMAVSIGYDWLYDNIKEEHRQAIIDAVVNKSFIPSLNDKESRFFNESNNWNQVCNASLLYGAISFMEDAPDLSNHIIERCLYSNPKAISMYSPDGGYPEGYNYWSYGTMYQILLIDALERTFGNDYELLSTPGFLETGYFAQFMTTPLGGCFNFGDSPLRSKGNIPMFWFANKNSDSSLIYHEFKLLNEQKYVFEEDKFLPLIPILMSRQDNGKPSLPTRHIWKNNGKTPTFVYRSGWDSRNDTYLSVKGGSPSTSHAHMDAGSFIYECNGVRWATDLGMQDYNSLESKGVKLWDNRQEGDRWNIMRMRNDYHNTLSIDSGRHIVKSKAEIIKVFNEDKRKGAVVDLTSTLGKVKQAHREVSINSDSILSIIDSICIGEKSVQLSWIMVTPTNAHVLSPNSISLKESGKQMLLSIESPIDINICIWPNTPTHPYDAPNPNTVRVGFTTNIPANKNIVLKTTLTHI